LKTTQRYFFKKQEKLKSRKAISSLFAEGQQFTIFPIKVYWQSATTENVLQVGISVGSKHFKKAVDRNRIKRLIREAYRLQKNQLNEHLIHANKNLTFFVIYIGKDLPDYKEIYKKTGMVLNKLIALNHENH